MTTFSGHLLEGTHASRPAATAVPAGTLYSCSDHGLIYQSDGATWSTWATLGGGSVVAGDIDSEAATDDYVLTADGAGAAAWEAAGGGGAWTLLSTTTLGSPATFDVSSISGSYNDLILVLIARGADAGITDTPRLTLNNDSGANYQREVIITQSSTAQGTENRAQNFFSFGAAFPAGAATAGRFAVSEMIIPGYASTTWMKSVICNTWAHYGTSAGSLTSVVGGGVWLSTSAVNRVTIVGATTANWATGSQLRIYGRL